MTAASPPPPPPVVPVPNVAAARTSAADAMAALEATMRRAALLTEGQVQCGVNGEWSTVESLRHLVLVVDVWLSRTILGEADPFHPIGLPPSFMPTKLPGTSIDPDAKPTFAETCDVLQGRLATITEYLDALSEAELTRPIEGHAETVGGGLSVLFSELEAHNFFINRDLDIAVGARASS